MIPLVSIGNSISCLFFLFISVLTYLSYKKKQNIFTLYFLKVFICLAIFFLFSALPGLVLKTPLLVAIAFLASYIWFYTVVASFNRILFHLLDKPKGERVAMFFILMLLIFTIFVGVGGLKPAYFIERGQFIYWIPNVDTIIRLLIGLASALMGVALVVATFFVGIQSKNKRVLTRSFLLGGGMLALASASLINYVSGVLPSPFVFLIASSVTIVSAILFIFGIYYKVEERK